MKLGKLSFDTTEYASRANAVLGIRDSGKSYTATGLAEQLLDSRKLNGHGIPFITFDPAGIWRFLRVPGAGKGYKVIVVGGPDGDLPLKAATAGKIVEAALRGGASLIFNLSGQISKGEMRKIVTDCVSVLMDKNAKYGLRHVFIEEAAEFVPQRVSDGIVYAAIEKLVRVGGNMGLGVTLINPRTQNLNKEVLELCDNIFLHRQKGTNSLKHLQGWFDSVGAEAPKEMVKSISKLQSGQCYAWLRDMDEPELVQVQQKNSFHPNRRDLQAATSKKTTPVDTADLIEALKHELPEVEAEMNANDPVLLKAEVARLKGELAKKLPPAPIVKVDVPAIKKEAFDNGVAAGRKQAARSHAAISRLTGKVTDAPVSRIPALIADIQKELAAMDDALPAPAMPAEPLIKPGPVQYSPATPPRPRVVAVSTEGAKEAGGAAMRILAVLASRHPARFTMGQWAVLAKLKKSGGTWNTYVSRLRQAGMLDERDNTFGVSDAGLAAWGGEISTPETPEQIRETWKQSVGSGPAKMIDILAGSYPEAVSKEDLAAAMEPPLAPAGGTFNTYLSRLNTNLLITVKRGGKGTPSMVRISDTLMEK